MKIISPYLLLLPLYFMNSGCSSNQQSSDAYGNFEADEITISAEASGRIMQFGLEEGDKLEAGEMIGYIDTSQLVISKKQLIASRAAIASKTGNIVSQIDVLHENKKNLLREKSRIENLLRDGAATRKQLDDIHGQLAVLESQIKSIETQNAPIANELKSIDAKIEQVNDQIRKSVIINPIEGTVLSKYTSENELTGFGKPLYKIADLKKMNLRVYISAQQLHKVAVGDRVKVLVDGTENRLQELEGSIAWISPTAEFTPKTIQTREERINLVYAMKVRIENSGIIKIGMPGEVKFIESL